LFKKVILEAGFSDSKEIIALKAKMLPAWFYSDVDWENTARIAKVKVPILIMHGTDDKTVPYEMALQLRDR
jgi:pimeloyl-ACP methyl ester carboxylesterase